MKKTTKLTTSMLESLVKEELEKAKKAKETDADELADSLEKQFDFAKALGLEEKRLIKRLKSIKEQKERILKRLSAS